jgi:hypothetical protein
MAMRERRLSRLELEAEDAHLRIAQQQRVVRLVNNFDCRWPRLLSQARRAGNQCG